VTQKRKRLSRPKLARTAPIRDFSTIVQREDSPSPKRADATSAVNGSFSDTVAHGARLGYSVIQEQIREGRRVAQQLSQISLAGEHGGNEIGRLIQRMLNFSTDFGALLVEVTEAMLRAPNGGDVRPERSHDGETATHAHNGTSSQISVEIEARGRSRVTLDLGANASTNNLAVPALYSLDGDSAPLTQISFAPHALRVTIPDDQPAGTYTGVVVDPKTNEPRGTLSVQLTR
jgi:hypothetical protein